MDRMSNADISRMKREAIKRANDANRKVCGTQNNNTDKPPKESAGKPDNKEQPKKNNVNKSSTPAVSGFDNILNLFMKDGERILLIILIMILADEECDMELIFALMYLII